MLRKITLVGMILFGMAAAVGPLQVSAGGDPLASPTPRATQRITAPVISGVNPEVYLSEGEQGDITPSDIPESLTLVLPGPMPALLYKELEPVQLAVPFQFQEGSVDCGPASLAMALTYLNQLEGSPPLSNQELGSWLRQRGLIYDWGTGVEELAFAARGFGYVGSTALHDWSLAELQGELGSGRPVLVPLGRGPDGAGHFLTVTGVSPDGKRFFGLDPMKGGVEYSEEEFRSLWELQGNSALILRKEAGSSEGGLALPLMGLVSAVSALALAVGMGKDQERSKLLAGFRKELANPRRQGIGGGVLTASPVEVSDPRSGESKGQPPPGFKQVQVEVPVYETRSVQVGLRGIKRQVPVYETRKVFAGLRKDVQQVPVYGLKKVITGTRWVEKKIPVTRYRTKQVWTWKKVTKRVPVTRRIHGKPIVIGYKNQTSWKRVQVAKKVPYQSSKTLLVKEPVYGYKKVQTGTRTVTRWVPRYQEKQVQVGTKTVLQTVPVYEQHRVQVGTRTVTRLVPIDGGGSGPLQPGEDPGDEEPGRDPASDLRLLDKLIADSDQLSPPTGFSQEVWESLSAEDQARIRKDRLERLQEYYRQEKLKNNRIYKFYRFSQTIKEKLAKIGEGLGMNLESKDLPHLFSLSAQKEVPVNMLTEDGIVIDTFRPPYFLDLFYMQHELVMKEKAIVTTYPDAPIDVNLSTKSIAVKAGKISLFGDLQGDFGFSFALNEKKQNYQEVRSSYLFRIDMNGFVSKYKKEGYKWEDNVDNPLIRTKFINTLECKVSIIRTEGLAILAASIVLLYLILSSGAGAYFPSWQNLLNLPI